MNILAIDPGTEDFGVADYSRSELVLYQCHVAGKNATERRRRLLDADAIKLPRWDYRTHYDAVVVEKQYLQRKSVTAAFSLAMSAGQLVSVLTQGRCPVELLEVAAGSWNYRGRGLARATRLATKLGVDLEPAPDAKSALGLLLWYLDKEGIEAEVTSLALDYVGLCGAKTPGP